MEWLARAMPRRDGFTRRVAACAMFALLALATPRAQAERPADLRLSYDVHAAGLNVAAVEAQLALGPSGYSMRLAYHTTGIFGFFRHGHQLDRASGVWSGQTATPFRYESTGRWGGDDRLTLIDYHHGDPVIRAQTPPDRKEREPVPAALQAHSMDSLSALALLMRQVAQSGRCDLTVHTFDGRRASEVTARTVGYEVLPHSGGSIFAGPALRCDFTGRMLAGFKRGENGPAQRKPLHGSAWFARAVPGAPPVPVRLTFQTRWFGEATLFLTTAMPATPDVAERRRPVGKETPQGRS